MRWVLATRLLGRTSRRMDLSTVAAAGFAPSTPPHAWTPEMFASYLANETPKFVAFVHSSLLALQASGSSACHLRFLDKMQIEQACEWTLDHVCYRCEEEAEYTHLARTVLPAMATLLVESEVGGRPIATFKLHAAISLAGGRSVNVLEVPMPKRGSFYKRGLEHAEIVVPYDLVQFIKAQKNDAIVWDLKGMAKDFNREARIALGAHYSVKFHEQTLEAVIAEELRQLQQQSSS